MHSASPRRLTFRTNLSRREEFWRVDRISSSDELLSSDKS